MKTLLLLFMLTQHKIDIPTRTDTLHYQVMTLDSLLIWWDSYDSTLREMQPLEFKPSQTDAVKSELEWIEKYNKRAFAKMKLDAWMNHLRDVLNK